MTSADRLEQTARLLREIPVSERTEALIELQVMLINCTVRSSPEDSADLAMLLAKLMRG